MMKPTRLLVLLNVVFLGSASRAAAGTFVDPRDFPTPPADAIGFPSRDPNLDVLPGFQNPPPGYGEVPFWWWTGDPLDKERLLWQIEQLHEKGISGMQVNYAHEDSPGRRRPSACTAPGSGEYLRPSRRCSALPTVRSRA